MRRTEWGQALIETALVVPLLILLVIGAVDIGRAFSHAMVVTNAARKGARAGARLPCSAGNSDPAFGPQRQKLHDAIVTATQQEASNSGVDLTDAKIILTPSIIPDSCPGVNTTLRVTVEYAYPDLFGFNLTLRNSVDFMFFGANY